MSDEEFERDADAVGRDLAALKLLVETAQAAALELFSIRTSGLRSRRMAQ